jgi:hypothetical protein
MKEEITQKIVLELESQYIFHLNCLIFFTNKQLLLMQFSGVTFLCLLYKIPHSETRKQAAFHSSEATVMLTLLYVLYISM